MYIPERSTIYSIKLQVNNHVSIVLNNPKGKPVLLTLQYIIKLISNYIKRLIKSYLTTNLNKMLQGYNAILSSATTEATEVQIRPKTEPERYTER